MRTKKTAFKKKRARFQKKNLKFQSEGKQGAWQSFWDRYCQM